MNRKKYRFEMFQIYEYRAIEEHLNHMAEKGWRLDSMNAFFWIYRRMEPAKLTYKLAYFSEGSDFDPGPTENQQTYMEYCKEAGWQYVSGKGQMQVFCTEKEDAVPIETDEEVKLLVIGRTMKKSFLPSAVLMLVLSFLQILMQWSNFSSHPIDFLSRGFGAGTALLWILLGGYLVYGMAAYGCWYARSKKSTKRGGSLAESNTKLQRIVPKLVICLLLLIFSATLASVFSSDLWWSGILGILLVTAVMSSVFGIKNLFKRMQVPGKTNRILTVLLSIALSVALTIFLSLSLFRIARTPNNNPALNTAKGLPLTIDELDSSINTVNYKYQEEKSSFLISRRNVRQYTNSPTDKASSLAYEILEIKLGSFYEVCKKEYLNQYRRYMENREFVLLSDPVWEAQEAFQLYRNGEACGTYVICYPEKLIFLEYDTVLTNSQIEVVKENLVFYPNKG